MSIHDDDLTTREEADRVYYATGVFLDADDLKAEQRYHRGRLARTLLYLHGSGTAAGLKVSWSRDTDHLTISAGIAVDRLGRLIEVPEDVCTHVGRWLEYHRNAALNPDEYEGEQKLLQSVTAEGDTLVADVYVRFTVCERGRTPAFATGPFDAIDATVPHRLRDAYEVSLVLRGGDGAPLPASAWPSRGEAESFESWRTNMQASVLDAWQHGSDNWQQGALMHDASTEGTDDPTSVFLARVRIPVTLDGDGIPESRLDEAAYDALPDVSADNHSRLFVYPTGALSRWVEELNRVTRLT
ncbi:MAG: hypothetical protein H6741_02385 [Alphaproteobacteria bacterium]|nr:hypothetical protein [Alphaproteobacteria bacterium]MCB9791552.1 hypothetical protein [Alphaproteobacteria bacterium]